MTKMKRWSKRDDLYVINNFRSLSLVELAKRMNRSTDNVSKSTLRLSKQLKEWASEQQANAPKAIPGVTTGFKSGYDPELKVIVRSGWERNILLWLNYLNIEWQYEPQTFVFPGIKQRFTRSYLPDIYLPQEDKYLEVKGYLRSKDITKLKRMKLHYPEIFKKLYSIPGGPNTKTAITLKEIGIPVYAYYNDIRSQYKNIIPSWE